MAQILVLTDSADRSGEVVYRERVPRSSLDSEHFSGQLLERVGWAVKDADDLEHRVEEAAADPAPAVPEPAIPAR
ncbi:MAG TPA: hypothetical protein VF009_07655 [Solirubrobacterales bacterium]